jgi:hypothetical protein
MNLNLSPENLRIGAKTLSPECVADHGYGR